MSNPATKLIDPLHHVTPEFLQDPYPTMQRLRSEAPVFWSDKGKYWIITRYSDAHTILRDQSYEKGLSRMGQVNPLVNLIPPASELRKSTSHWMLTQNPPDHTRLRSLLNKAFTPAMVQQMRPDIQEIADRLIESVRGKRQVELVSEYAFVLPVTVIAAMLGVPAEDRDKFHKWSHALTEMLEPRMTLDLGRINRANEANKELIEYLRPLVQERRKNPRNDLISALVEAEEQGSKLTEDELLANCVLLLVAGHETTVNLIGNGVLALLRNPDQLELLKKEPDLIQSAVEEFLRYESPIQLVRRVAAYDMELGGQKIDKDDMLVVLLGACNRDPEVFPNPDKLDIRRSPNKHIAFSEGIHFCLGASLARLEGQIAISTLFKELPDIRLATEKLEFKQPFALRGLKEMPVSF
ncbi:MAG TPA: cytochrome P450 [Candidatus Obscuribacterales bacterium]